MKTPLDNLDSDLLDLLSIALRDKYEQACLRRDVAIDEVAEIEEKMERLRSRMSAEAAPITPALTLSGRVKKGESERLISHFLQSRNGTGVTISETSKETKTTYGTARRILRLFTKAGKATESDGRFRWTKNNLSAQSESEGATPNGKAKLRLIEV